MVYCIVLAGGNGTRLWPLSREDKPKQVIQLPNGQTLLGQAVDRCRAFVEKKRCCIVSLESQHEQMEKLVGADIGKWIFEPFQRNTAAAMLLSAYTLSKINEDAILVFVTADHHIPETDKFVSFLHEAVNAAYQTDRIILLGIRPTYAATGYGYIQFNHMESHPARVTKFHEKPDSQKAEQYLHQGYVWNSGMFVCKASVLLSEAKKHAPEILKEIDNYLAGQSSYASIPSQSIDCAVMEKSSKLSVLPVDFIWSDVGNLETFLTLNQPKSDVVSIEANNNLVQVSDKLVALIGVDDLCVVEQDDVLVIAHKNKVEKVKNVVQHLEEEEKSEYL